MGQDDHSSIHRTLRTELHYYILMDKDDGASPKNFGEAVHIWLESIRLERSLIGSTIEETFIVQVFDILRNEINDIGRRTQENNGTFYFRIDFNLMHLPSFNYHLLGY